MWAEARDAQERAIERGGLRRLGNAWPLVQAHWELGDAKAA